jgi:replication fork clamp-binding protein CrfC
MTSLLLQCSNLADNVKNLLNLLAKETNLTQDTSAIEASLKKVIAPKFEIVFAGAFSAGKSMLINALLERELLYSAEGHATGTECYIEYAEPAAEKVVLTFLSETEITEQAMEEFNFSNLTEAASYARRGSNSSVLKKVEYYCHHHLLKDGNVLVDMPGIDAPVKKDAELTYSKVEHPDTSGLFVF